MSNVWVYVTFYPDTLKKCVWVVVVEGAQVKTETLTRGMTGS